MRVLKRKGFPPKSIRNVIGTLSALCNFARSPERGSVSNRCEGLEFPAVSANVGIRLLTLAQIDALVDNARPGLLEAVDRAMYRTAAMTGLRQAS